jgi:oligopeptide transport system substrate-binding protein
MRYHLIILLCLFVLCIGNLTEKIYAESSVTIQVTLPPIETIDPVALPHYPNGVYSIIDNLFVGLTRYDSASNAVQNVLAKSWTVSEDQLTWTFTLRDDIQWVRLNREASPVTVDSVRPVVAGDFVYAFQRACDPPLPNPVTHTIYIVKGCQQVATTNPDFVDTLFIARTLGVQALSDTTLEIKLEFPMPQFPMLLTLPEFRPVPHEAISNTGDWTNSDTIITNGPFLLQGRDATSMTLIRNSRWLDPFSGNADEIHINFQVSNTAQSLANGDSVYSLLNMTDANSLHRSHPDLVHVAPGKAVTVLGFSTERNVVNKDPFRRALAQSIDRDALALDPLLDTVLPISRLMPPGYVGGTTAPPDNSGFKADLAQAALKDAFPRCRLPERVVFAVEESLVPVAQWMVNQWKEILNCPVALFSIQKRTAEEINAIAHGAVDTASTYSKPRPHLWLFTWTPDYPDANAALSDALHCRYGYMRTGFPCTDADLQLDAAFMEPDPVKRAELYDKAEVSWFGDSGTFPVAPLYVSVDAAGWSTRLKGATVSPPLHFDTWFLEPNDQ